MAGRATPTPQGAPDTTPGRCAACARALVQPARGRRRTHCSAACRKRAYRARQAEGTRRGLVRLVEGDALAFLATLAPESVDLVVTDPPYAFARGTTYFRRWFADLPDAAWPEVLRALYRVLRPDRHAYLICDRRTRDLFGAAATGAGFRLAETLVWDKGSIGLGGGAWRPQHEYVLFLAKGSRAGNRRDLGTVLYAPRPGRGAYPTEKPQALLRPLIAQSSAPGELVLDPFCGSGGVGRAARDLGRRALLCDVDASTAARRLRLVARALEHAEA